LLSKISRRPRWRFQFGSWARGRSEPTVVTQPQPHSHEERG